MLISRILIFNKDEVVECKLDLVSYKVYLVSIELSLLSLIPWTRADIVDQFLLVVIHTASYSQLHNRSQHFADTELAT